MSFLDKLAAQISFGKKEETAQYLFALNIGLSEVSAAVWGIYGHKLDVLGQATSSYKGTEDLLDRAHQVLDKSLGALEIEPSQILFGVPDSWTMDENLKEPYLKLVRRMTEEYDLQPMAYVTTTHAISHYLQKSEGVPPTAILIGVGEFLEVTLLRGGKAIGTREGKRGEQLFEDLEKLLIQFTEVEVLPSKILLYSTSSTVDLEKIKADLMSYPWMQQLPFLHFPKIDLLDEDTPLWSIVLAGAAEINPEVEFKQSLIAGKKSSLSTVQGFAPTDPSRRLHKIRSRPTGPVLAEGSEDLGFIAGDIEQQAKNSEVEEDLLSHHNLAEAEMADELAIAQPGRYEQHLTGDNIMAKMRLSAFFKKFLPQGGSGRRLARPKLLLIPALLVLLVAAYLFFVKATVTVFVEPKVLERDAEVTADPAATTADTEKKIIPGTVIETKVSGSGSGPATGSKQIGDPARGTVIIYNATSNAVSFSQGTTLVGDSGLKFALDTSVQIASKSASAAALPSTSSSVGVTAVAIGPDSNILGGTELRVGGYSKSDVVAKVDQALSGGTSKTVTTVTGDDQKKLQAQVVDKLRQKAQDDLQAKMAAAGGTPKKVIPEALAVIDGKYNFSKQVNDQAADFTLNATIHFKGVAYSDEDLRMIVSKLVETNIPGGFILDLNGTETQADVKRVDKDSKLIFAAKFKAKLLPMIDTDALKDKIRGQSIAGATELIRQLDGVLGSEISLYPPVPSKVARLPLWGRNITISVTSK